MKPYRVVPGLSDPAEVAARCNARCFAFTTPLAMTNALGEYVLLLLALRMDERIEVLPLRDLLAPLAEDKLRVAIRHDVDHDLPAAAQMCEVERAIGVCASYYLHHASAYYYGEFDAEGVFHRHEGAAALYRRIQQSGAEIGLHADPLAVFQRGVNGVEALRTELAWLRGQGLNIRGSTAHGSAPYYGAENFEVFRGRKFLAGETVSIAGEEIPLGCVAEEELGLEYEGNFAAKAPNARREDFARYLATPAEVDPREHMRLYLHDNPHVRWGQDYTAWLLGRNCWVFASTDPQGMFEYGVGIEDVLALLKGLPGGRRLVIHVHPCYYGFRTAEDQDPLPWEKACCGAAAPLVSQLDLANIKCDLGAAKRRPGGLFFPGWRNSKPAWRGSSGSWRKSASTRGRTTASSTPPESENWGNTFFDAAQPRQGGSWDCESCTSATSPATLTTSPRPCASGGDVEADVFTHDYRYYISDPEWEDGDIEPVRFDDPHVPIWSEVNLKGFRRPEWYAEQLDGLARRRLRNMAAKDLLRIGGRQAALRRGDGGVSAAARQRAVCGRFARAAARPVRRTGGGLSQNADGARLAALVNRAIPKNPRRVVCAAGREGTRAVRPRRRQDGLAVLPLRHHPGLRRLGADVAAAACARPSPA